MVFINLHKIMHINKLNAVFCTRNKIKVESVAVYIFIQLISQVQSKILFLKKISESHDRCTKP